MGKLGPFTYETLAGEIDRQSWVVGSDYPPADTVTVWRFCQTFVERTVEGHPVMEQSSLNSLAPNFRLWQDLRTARRQSGLKQFQTDCRSGSGKKRA